MDKVIENIISAFSPISLETLNGKAAMLDRLDNKYIVRGQSLRPAFAAFLELFDVLEIEGKRAFTYTTRYFDDVQRRSYFDHLQRRRKRCKVRVRHYVDTGFSYLEVKLKEQRATTSKRRLSVDKPLTELDGRCMEFIDHCYRDSYDEGFIKPLTSVIVIDYQRITLVAKEGGERMTIDTALDFHTTDIDRTAPSDMFIIETKSVRGNGIADKILRSLHLQPTKHVSKYCIGMAATGQVSRRNSFLPALRRLHLMEPVTPARSPLSFSKPNGATPILRSPVSRSKRYVATSSTTQPFDISLFSPAIVRR